MMSQPVQKPPIPPVLVLLLGMLAVSAASIFIRYAQVYAPSLVIAAYRLVLACLILAPVAYLRYRAELRILGLRDLRLALLSGFFLALHFATWITSLEYTSVASSVVLVSTTPLWVALLSPFTLREPVRRVVLAGMILALAGGTIIGLSDACTWQVGGLACPPLADFVQGEAFLGDLLALAGALMAAAYILIGRSLRGKMSLIPYIFVVYGMAALVLVALMLGAGQPATGYPAPAYGWFLLLAIFPQLLGHSTFNWALRYLSAAYVSIALLGEPVGSTILAYFLLQETPTSLKIFGAILILTGIYIASRSEARQPAGELLDAN
jgi:drug/metabolite transporter (DMT)-like permease